MISFAPKSAEMSKNQGKKPGNSGKPGNVPWFFKIIFPSLLKDDDNETHWESRDYKVWYNIISLIIICSLASLAFFREREIKK